MKIVPVSVLSLSLAFAFGLTLVPGLSRQAAGADDNLLDPFVSSPGSDTERAVMLRTAAMALIRMQDGPDQKALQALLDDSVERMKQDLKSGSPTAGLLAKSAGSGSVPGLTSAPPSSRPPVTASEDLARMELKRTQLEALLAATPELPKDHVLLRDGRKIALTSITALAPTGLRFIGNGIEVVTWENIDTRLAKAYGWSEDIQAEYEVWKKSSAAVNERQMAEAKRMALEVQKQEAESVRRAERERAVQASASAVYVRVSQITKNGALGYGSKIERQKHSWEQSFDDYMAGKVEFVTSAEHEEPIYIVGLPSRLVDGDKWAGWLFPCGNYSYTTVAGGAKTVRKYATTAKQALSVLDGAE